MLTYIILAALSVLVGILVINKINKTETSTPVETKEEEPIGYESGSFASVVVEEPTPVVAPKPKKKSTPKTTAAKPKKAKKQDA